ncbi:hypothetical protein AtDm6_0226 [Acetobacter tropicalis]|uniref:Uncharacterized protein n=1 Tax=Acetobacter tropicalis TaxID=104102 RepID=A0A094ZWJ7_9PROT|nr:hypothetical protein AtDm6_0226 [Acetobacter tropicalis]
MTRCPAVFSTPIVAANTVLMIFGKNCCAWSAGFNVGKGKLF